MIALTIDELKPGMIVARSVMSGETGIRLAAGYVLEEAVISRCKRIGMRALWVHLDGEEVVPDCNVNDQLALQAQQSWKENIDFVSKVGDSQSVTLDNLRQFTDDSSRFKNIIATRELKSVVNNIIQSILSQEPLVLNLASIRTKDGYLYQHALDVTITAVMLAHQLKFPLKDVQEMALGCFLMDLGMIIIPQALFEKKTPLSLAERRLLREHPMVGYTILRANEGITINAAHIAYQHHELINGSGFPRSLREGNEYPKKVLGDVEGKIHRYALIAAVADRYNSAISPRPEGPQPMAPLEAMRMLISEAGEKINAHVVNALITLIPVFPTGTRVLVTKAPRLLLLGCLGVVARANLLEKEKPQVILLFDKFKRKIKPEVIDLALDKGYEIQFAPLE